MAQHLCENPASGGNARSFDNWYLRQASGASIGEGGLGCLFQFIRLLPQVAEATPALISSVAWLHPTASCSLSEKLLDVNAVSAFNTMFIVLVSQGKSRKSSEKCCYLDREATRPPNTSARSIALFSS